jgi:hypothetical protein
VRDGYERLRLRVDERRAVATDRLPQREGQTVGDEVGGEQYDEEPGPAPDQRKHGTNQDEQEPLGADPREVDEQPVQPADPVLDDPALQVPVERDQVGSSCLVWSISSCGLNGLPMKAWAPREVASSAACSSTFPLNMITGMAPTPCRS